MPYAKKNCWTTQLSSSPGSRRTRRDHDFIGKGTFFESRSMYRLWFVCRGRRIEDVVYSNWIDVTGNPAFGKEDWQRSYPRNITEVKGVSSGWSPGRLDDC